MIEMPEAVTLARQMREELVGRTIQYADSGNSPHKFAWYGRLRDQFGAIMPGKRVADATVVGADVLMHLSPGYVFLIGHGGPALLLHSAGATLPKKRQLLVQFDDGRCLTASIRMYGALQLLTEAEAAACPRPGITPLDRAFTPQRLTQMLRDCDQAAAKSIKYFIINAHVVGGIGNGYLHDILFRAGVRPTRKVADLKVAECRKLHAAAAKVMKEAVTAGGRDTERDLLGRPGGYRCILDSRAASRPCPACGTEIEKASYLGGACYFCPACQS